METILKARAVAAQENTMADQGALLPCLLVWHPHLADEVCLQQTSQRLGAEPVGLNPGFSNQACLKRVGDHYSANVGFESIIGPPSVRACLQDGGVVLDQMLRRPVGQVVYRHPLVKEQFSLVVHGGDFQILVVGVQAKET